MSKVPAKKVVKTQVASPSKQSVAVATIHDSVTLDDNLKGTIKFIGPVQDKQGVFYGIELTEAKGKNDGSVNGVSYFKCGAKKGIFVQKAKIINITPSLASKTYPRVTVGDRVKIPSKKCNGIVRYIGEPAFKDGIWYGVELDDASGKNNGTVMNRFYFECENNKGTFLKSKEILSLSGNGNGVATNVNTTATTNAKSTTSSSSSSTGKKPAPPSSSSSKKPKEEKKEDEKEEKNAEYKLGDKILVKPTKKGQIKYVGAAKYLGEGIWYGVRLTEKRGTCNGEYKGHKFFTCPDAYGIYIQKKDIIRKLNEEEGKDFNFVDEEKQINQKKEEKLLVLKEQKDYLLKIKQKFRELDSDGNHTIDLSEWKNLASNLKLENVNEQNFEQVFYEIDVSKSGEISFAEFEKWYNTVNNTNQNKDDQKSQNVDEQKPKEEESHSNEEKQEQKPQNEEEQKPQNEEEQKPQNEEEQNPQNEEEKNPQNEEEQQPNEAEDQQPNEAEDQQPNEAEEQQPNEAEEQQPDEAEEQQPNEEEQPNEEQQE